MVQETPSRKLDQYIVRLPDGMRERIKKAAADNNRSMNAEIVAALEEKFPVVSPTQEITNLLTSMSPEDRARAVALIRSLVDY